jgi:hypothetical protein
MASRAALSLIAIGAQDYLDCAVGDSATNDLR